MKAKPGTAGRGTSTFTSHPSCVVNHSDGGFLLRFELSEPLLCVGSLLCLRGSEAEPWTVAAVRWIEDTEGTVMTGCEVLCNFAEAQIAQNMSSTQHLPAIKFQKDETPWLIAPYDAGHATGVSQLKVDDELWVIAVATELGEDWQRSAILDVTPKKRAG